MILTSIPQIGVIRLSLTCTAFRSHPAVLKCIYTEPFNKDDLPLWDYDSYCYTHKRRFDPIIRGINVNTGLFVRRMAMHSWASLQDLQHLAQHCPNLDTVDFSGVFEPIDYLNFRQLATNRPPCLHHPDARRFRPTCGDCSYQFRWSIMLQRCPEFFQKLRSVKVNHGVSWVNDTRPVDGGAQIRTQFFLLLQSCPRLENLRFQGTSLYNHFHTPRRMEKLHRTILNAAAQLKTIGYSNNPEARPMNLAPFLRGFRILDNCEIFELSIHQELQKHEGLFKKTFVNGDLQFDLQRQETSVVRYIKDAKAAFETSNWRIVPSDTGCDYPCKPSRYYECLEAGKSRYLQFLCQTLHWTPLFTWERHILNYSSWAGWDVEEDPDALGHADWPPNYDWSKCRRLFRRLKSLNTPVRLLLTPGKWDHGSFFWYDRWAKGFETYTRCLEFQQEHHPHYKSYSVEKWNNLHKPALEHFGKNELDFYHRACDLDATNWNLFEVGDFVDELRIIWTDKFGLSGGSEADDLEINNRFGHGVFSRRGEDILPLRLAHEAKRIAPLFKFLARDFPNLSRLALYIPAALYVDHDQIFIDHILPGEGWMVHHSGSGGGAEAKQVPEEYLNWYYEPTHPTNAYCNDAYDVLPESEAEYRADLARCPLIHRVFTRRAGVYTIPALEHEMYSTKRPLVDLRSPNMLELIHAYPDRDFQTEDVDDNPIEIF